MSSEDTVLHSTGYKTGEQNHFITANRFKKNMHIQLTPEDSYMIICIFMPVALRYNSTFR